MDICCLSSRLSFKAFFARSVMYDPWLSASNTAQISIESSGLLTLYMQVQAVCNSTVLLESMYIDTVVGISNVVASGFSLLACD